jgi:hypothetical protein
MFRAEDIQERLRQRPFRPLRIIASEGQRFDIYHPDLVLVGRRDLMIGFPSSDNPTVYDRVTYLALVHVVAREEIPVPSESNDGQP